MSTSHYVPLSRQVIELIAQLHGYTGETKWLFPGQVDPEKCMSKNTILAALDAMGYKRQMTRSGIPTSAERQALYPRPQITQVIFIFQSWQAYHV